MRVFVESDMTVCPDGHTLRLHAGETIDGPLARYLAASGCEVTVEEDDPQPPAGPEETQLPEPPGPTEPPEVGAPDGAPGGPAAEGEPQGAAEETAAEPVPEETA